MYHEMTPGLQDVRERVWIESKTGLEGGNLKVLTDDKIFVTRLARKYRDAFDAQLMYGEPISSALENNALVIPLKKIDRVVAHKNKTSLMFEGRDIWLAGRVIGFESTSCRDDFVEALRERLGSDFLYSQRSLSKTQVAIVPVILILFVIGQTLFFRKEAIDWAAGKSIYVHIENDIIRKVMCAAVGFLDPTSVLVVGAVLLVGAVVLLVKQMRSPPTIIELQRVVGRLH